MTPPNPKLSKYLIIAIAVTVLLGWFWPLWLDLFSSLAGNFVPQVRRLITLLTPNSYKQVGLVLSIIGTWLSGISIIGKKRLTAWDEWLKLKMNAVRNLSFLGIRIFEKNIELVAGLIGTLFCLMMVIIYVTMNQPYDSVQRTLPFIFVIVLWILVASVILLPYALAGLFLLFTFPYWLFRNIESEGSLERILIFMGCIALTLGIVLLR